MDAYPVSFAENGRSGSISAKERDERGVGGLSSGLLVETGGQR
jgi:hypothetical protein